MATASKQFLTPEEYLARERRAEIKSEYLRGEMFAMSGATFEHTRIKDNVAREAGNQLKGGPCQELTSDMRVKVDATGLYTYPDIVIVCDQPRFEDNIFDTLLNPRPSSKFSPRRRSHMIAGPSSLITGRFRLLRSTS